MAGRLDASIGSPLPISSHSLDSSLGLVAPSGCPVPSPYVTQPTWFCPERQAVLPLAVPFDGPSSFKRMIFPLSHLYVVLLACLYHLSLCYLRI
ncbi:hypothetical protein Nepgr_009313 [Nepenthes gracilis]|uniref:Uncharacterized protein n=1 Tax=Nepenthes gracilis TaxID=150966 RepID=A0AAD3SAD8_NEPGR|nr:hypothetical protein Nepgr_009313 [Nepenthes gracilis]